MDETEYIRDRVADQIDWYDNKSQFNKKWFMGLRVIEILVAISIPFFVGYITDTQPNMKIIVGLLGLVVAFSSGIVALYKFQENWIQYRTTSESLKHEKYLYLTGCSPYENDNAFNLFVERFESLISSENSKWAQNSRVDKPEETE